MLQRVVLFFGRKSIYFAFAAGFLLLTASPVFPEQYQVKFNRISIQDTTVYRGLPAGFDYPVLSVITVTDASNRYVHGLASRDKWLYPSDMTETEETVDDVWRYLKEYHRDNKSVPENSSIKQTDSLYMVTELEGLGSSVILAMDYSASMDEDIFLAQEGALGYVRKMSRNDRTAILKFTGIVALYQDFTSDTTLLIDAIKRQPDERQGTPLYQAIYQSISECADESGRRAVVVYTDGKDTRGGRTVEEIIQYAVPNKVRLYTIGLGGGIEETELRTMANSTGGVYLKARRASDLAEIYATIYKHISGYYVMAHQSTDPFFNGTWRTVDITLRSLDNEGEGWGEYFVPFIPSDMVISKVLRTDSIQVTGTDTVHYALAGDTLLYDIAIINQGMGPGGVVTVTDIFPDSMAFLDAFPAPDAIDADSVSWSFPRLVPGESRHMQYRMVVRNRMPASPVPLVNTARVYCPYDTMPANNRVEKTVYGFGRPDFTVSCHPVTGAASPGYSMDVTATVANEGDADQLQPVEVGFFLENTDGEPFATAIIPSLACGQSADVAGQWISPVAGTHRIVVKADYKQLIAERNESNNEDDCQVLVGIDSLLVRISEITYQDSVDMMNGTFPGTVLSTIHVVDQNIRPIRTLARLNDWARIQDNCDAGGVVGDVWRQVLEYHEADTTYPADPDVRASIRVREIRSGTISLAFAVDFSGVMLPRGDAVRRHLGNMIRQFSRSDWGSVTGFRSADNVLQSMTGDPEALVRALNQSYVGATGWIYDGLYRSLEELNVDHTAREAVLAVVGGDDRHSERRAGTVCRQAQMQGIPFYIVDFHAGAGSDSLRWLAEHSGGWYFQLADTVSFKSTIERIGELVRDYYIMAHASPDTIQDLSRRYLDVTASFAGFTGRDRSVYRAPLGITDIAITKEARSPDYETDQADTTWTVQPMDTVDYTLAVRNIGHWPVSSIMITDVLPANLIPAAFDLVPQSVEGSTLRWKINRLERGEQIRFGYRCVVDTLFTDDITELVNTASLSHADDGNPVNNTARDTVLYVPLTRCDLVVNKSGTGDSLAVVSGDTLWYAFPDRMVTYHVTIRNEGQLSGRNITVRDILPAQVTLQAFSGTAYRLHGDTLSWEISRVESRGGTAQYTYTCRVDSLMPPWNVPLVNFIRAEAAQEENLDNNTDQDTVWAAGIIPPGPRIQTAPALVEPLDTVNVQVMSPVDVLSWDLRIVFETGEEITTYADPFISTTILHPGQWISVSPSFSDTRMRTEQKQERVSVILETTGIWNDVRSDTAFFTIRSSDVFWLEENTYYPAHGIPLGLRFMLSSNRHAAVAVYDLAGGMIRKLASGPYPAGWNTVYWDGTDQNGRPVGSGIYVAVISAGEFKKAHKFIVVR